MLSLMRIVLAFMFSAHGAQKILGVLAGPEPRPAPEVFSQAWVGGMIELVGGVLLLLGLFTRPVAFLLSGTMAVAYFQFHAWTGGFWPILNKGELAAVYCWVFLYLAAAGGGPWSLDALIWKKPTA
jgi:putative oxidoreductase